MLAFFRNLGIALIVLAFGLGLDFSLAAKGREGYGLTDHITQRLAQVPLPALAASGLQAALPAAPQGWTVREGAYDDTFLVMEMEPSDTVRQVVKELERKTIAEVPGFENARSFMQSGTQMVVTDISFFPANTRALKMPRLNRDALDASFRQSAPQHVTQLNGITFLRATGPDYRTAAFYIAIVDDGLYVSLVTSLDLPEKEVMRLLQGFDLAALLAKVANDPTRGAPMLADASPDAGQICIRKAGIRTCRPVTN